MGKALLCTCLSCLVTLLLGGAVLWSRYGTVWRGTAAERRAAAHCHIPVGFTYHVEVKPLVGLPIFAVQCAAIAFLEPVPVDFNTQLEAEGAVNTQPVLSPRVLRVFVHNGGFYRVEQSLLVDMRTFNARPAGFGVTPLAGL